MYFKQFLPCFIHNPTSRSSKPASLARILVISPFIIATNESAANIDKLQQVYPLMSAAEEITREDEISLVIELVHFCGRLCGD